MTKKKKVSPVNESSLKTVEQEDKVKEKDNFFIVGIGASAGGLETLNAFLSIMPSDSGMAFVIIQHLSPDYKSIMVSLLEKQTHMAVNQIEDGTKVLPNHIYLNPPGKNVAIFNRTLHLLDPARSSAINMPVDFFFRSLSEDLAEKAIGIILSGTASDGTLGIKAIKGEGGMAMVQQPDTAKYDGMPRSAVETGLIDYIVPVEKMPETLAQYVQHPFLELEKKSKLTDSPHKNNMQKIFALIRSKTGHDFSQYKPNTISRRIERRLAVHQIKSLSDYILFIQKNPAEIETLFNNLVIGVTNFFRDPEAFKVLEQEVILSLLKDKAPDSTIRFWIAGCSTGEEAYSLAIIVSEIMEKIQKHFNVQIFATDIDPAAIDIARRGIYPENIGVDISPDRLRRFFTKNPDGFHVKKQIRDMIVFSTQNIIKDPPFSRLDLVSCRNLLIYMGRTLQKKIIPLFHYTLNPGGILFLGSSESIGEHTDLFKPSHSKLKIFIRGKSFTARGIDFPGKIYHDAQPRMIPDQESNLPTNPDVLAVIERTILDTYAPSGVLINDKYEILHFVGLTDKYLAPPTGKPSFNVLDMAREDLKNQLTISLHKAVQKKIAIVCKDVKVSHNGTFSTVDISILPMTDKGLPNGTVLITFDDKTPADVSGEKKVVPSKTRRKNTALKNLEQELHATEEYLQATIEELETSNEELKSTNEEMQSVNEEMQSTNEELETSKEELQSTNEELATVNTELQTKIDEYSKSNNDLNNLLAATEIATLFIDMNLCIKNYTPAATTVIKLIQTDIGRPLDDLKNCFGDVDLVTLARKVLKDLNTVEMEILSSDDIWYTMKIIPYRTVENLIDGVVMTFTNVDKIKQADKFMRLATILEDSNDAITVLGMDGEIRAWNKGAQRMYGWTEPEALKMNISDLLPDDKPDEMISIIGNFTREEPIVSCRSWRKTKTGKNLEVWLTVTALKDELGRSIEMATTERDLSWLTEKD